MKAVYDTFCSSKRNLNRAEAFVLSSPLTACQKVLMIYHFSLSGGNVCMRVKKDSAFPVLKYSYQNSSVSDWKTPKRSMICFAHNSEPAEFAVIRLSVRFVIETSANIAMLLSMIKKRGGQKSGRLERGRELSQRVCRGILRDCGNLREDIYFQQFPGWICWFREQAGLKRCCREGQGQCSAGDTRADPDGYEWGVFRKYEKEAWEGR